MHFHLLEVKHLILHGRAVHQRQITPFSLIEIQFGAVGCRHSAVQTHHTDFVTSIGVVDTVLPFG